MRIFSCPPARSWVRLPLAWTLVLAGALSAADLRAQTDQAVYDDALESGYQNWSWATVDLASTAVVHSGSYSIAVTAGAWQALWCEHAAYSTAGYGNLTFWINGGPTGGQSLNVWATLGGNAGPSSVPLGPLAANTWQQVTIPLSALGADNVSNFTGFWIQDRTGTSQPTFYVDDIVITGTVAVTPPPPLSGMALYQDSLVNGWQNWSWATVNLTNTDPVNSGSASIAVDAGAYQALFLHHSAIDTRPYATLTFWINGGAAGGQVINLQALVSDVAQPGVKIGPLPANGGWQQVSIPLADLGAANQASLTGFWFQEAQGRTIPEYYVDDIRLDFGPTPSAVNVTVANNQRIRVVDPRLFGVNTAVWDGAFDTPTTAGLLTEIDNQALRFPGGSLADVYHWQTNMSDGQNFQWATNFDAFANIASQTHAQTYVTVNYGTGTPAEAASWVQYANVTKHLGILYWEIGNEVYGSWETDHNTRPHDPVTYANRVAQYAAQMRAADRRAHIGVVVTTGEDSYANYNDESVVNPRTGQTHTGWTPILLTTLRQLGCMPDFVIYHRYEQNGGGESDTGLLLSAQTWPNDAANLRQMVNDYLHTSRQVEIACTENNSVSSNPGKQTTSLVNGLYWADSLGNILQTEFSSLLWWDLRNGQETGNDNSPFLYGWRNYGDYGIVDSATPAGPADRYPTFYVAKLLSHYARGGEQVIAAGSDFWGLGAYAVRGKDGALHVLLINKHPTASLPANLSFHGWTAAGNATVYRYGIPQDTAAQTGTGSADVQQTSMPVSGSTLNYTTPPYSATVLVVPGS